MKRLAVSFLLGWSAFGAPCACLGHGGAVPFAGQTNLVVWDAEKGVEHFVRDARFASGESLAFIAPTPSKPELSEASATAFSRLESLRPHDPATDTAGAVETRSASKGAVAILGVQDVAGFRATILKSTDAEALTTWLRSNGYPTPKFMSDWAAPYVRKGWCFTAFKVNGGATGPVRMSFETDRPFNPYSVPAENGGSGVPLRLFYVSAGAETPRIGGTATWRAAEWSADVPEETREGLASDLRLSDLPEGLRVTAYQDSEFGRAGFDDLYFVPDHSLRNASVVSTSVLFVLALALRRRKRNVLRPSAS